MAKKSSSKPAPSLKERNRLPLFGLVVANLAVFYLLASSADLSVAGLKAAIADTKNLLAMTGVGALAVISILDGIIPSSWKERLVFWRWRDVLPGHRAFTVHGPADARVDMTALKKQLGELPAAPGEQNRIWYRLFKQCDTRPEVAPTHRSYLFSREYTTISVVFLIFAGLSGFAVLPDIRTASIYVAALVAQFIVASLSARHHGTRMVTNTLALQNKA